MRALDDARCARVAFTRTSYSDEGQQVETIDARGKHTWYFYDAAGRQTTVRNQLLKEFTYTYDVNGNQKTFTDPKGNVTENFYDDQNRLVRVVFPDLSERRTEYDTLGRKTAEIDQAGKRTEFVYDDLGRLTRVKQFLGGRELHTDYTYDELGNRLTQTDAKGRTTTFKYDGQGRQIGRTLPDGKSESALFATNGNLISRTDFMGRTITNDYDPVTNLLTARHYPDGSSVSFTYTVTGRRETVTDSRGVTTYQYDGRDRVEALIYPDGRRLEYGYNENGARTRLTAVVGATTLTTTYAYDDLNRLSTTTDPLGRVFTQTYDDNGNRETLAYPNGITTTYTYDPLNRLTNLTSERANHSVVQSYAYTLGATGNRTKIVEADGTTSDYTYDDLYRLTSEGVTGRLNYGKTFVYDDVGNRESQTTTGSGAAGNPTTPGTVNYTYDNRDRLLTENGVSRTWDDNGNLTAETGVAGYDWDYDNRLARVTKADGTVVETLYDADGTRVQTKTTIGGTPVIVNYLVDTMGGLSQVVADSDAAGNVLTTYVRGDELLALIRPGGSKIYHADGHGSIRYLTDLSGTVTDRYDYTAFGEEITHTGSDAQPYRYVGESFDPNIGFYYNRARWMDPGVGRFVGVDPFQGYLDDARSLHKYTYAHHNPVNNLDPSGLMSLAEVNVVLGEIANLSKMTMNVVRLFDKAKSVVDIVSAGIDLMQLSTGGSFTQLFEDYFTKVFTDHVMPFTVEEAVISLTSQMPSLLSTGLSEWTTWLATPGHRVKSLLLYMPSPAFIIPETEIPVKLKVGSMPVKLIIGGAKSYAGRLIGVGFEVGGAKGGNKYRQMWRMDYHGYHGTPGQPSAQGRDILSWPDGPTFHYHVLHPDKQ